jgi:hypothetical protein
MKCKDYLIPILSLLLFSDCSSGSQQPSVKTVQTKTDSAQSMLETQEKDSTDGVEGITDTLGNKIATITVEGKATTEDLKTSKDPIFPWVNLDEPTKRIKNLISPDEVVLPYQKVTLVIDYPVAKPVLFVLTGPPSGFTRKQIVLAISKKYHELYKEEEKTAKTKTVPIGQRKTLANRNQTDGKYGIWGHDLGDLDLTSISVYQNAAGQIFLTLDVDS